ncbi:MAG TPA: TetR/AcrR family transcriptional regulator [Myxococcaceae bacterium]
MSSAPVKREIKQERAARTREEILEAAIREFSSRSFEATSMAQLAKTIRMTPGALYWHFPTKEDLLLGALEELHQRFMREFDFLVKEGRSLTARQQLKGFFDRTQNFFRYHRHYGKFFGMLTALSADANDRVASATRVVLEAYASAVAGIVRYGQEKTGEFRKDVDPASVGHTIVSAFSGMIVHQSLFDETLEYDPLAAIIVKLAVDGLSAGAPAPQAP